MFLYNAAFVLLTELLLYVHIYKHIQNDYVPRKDLDEYLLRALKSNDYGQQLQEIFEGVHKKFSLSRSKRGATCEKGEPGSAGPRGGKGSKGEPGDNGYDIKGEQGPPGSKGEKGPRGATGPPGIQGAKGRPGTNAVNGKPGLSGQKGEMGEKGNIGNNGIKGERGNDGPPGAKGNQGAKGESGQKGERSQKGESGQKGNIGNPGTNGEKGDIGPSGSKGDKGTEGSKGETGLLGPNGPPGPKGDSGSPGLAGPPGQEGKQGLRGDRGLSGAEDFANCKIRITPSEKKYTKFYRIVRNPRLENDSLLIEFNFSVYAQCDIYVTLAEYKLAVNGEVYDITIGPDEKVYSLAQKSKHHKVKHRQSDINPTAGTHVRSFWLRLWTSGLLQVGRQSEATPFLTYNDYYALNIKYLKISSFKQYETIWYIDCGTNILLNPDDF